MHPADKTSLWPCCLKMQLTLLNFEGNTPVDTGARITLLQTVDPNPQQGPIYNVAVENRWNLSI